MRSLGLDISSTSTGALLLDDKENVVFQAVWAPPKGLDYLDRGSWQAEKLINVIDHFHLLHGSAGIHQICIEGYSLGSTNGAEPLITVGTILRYFLRQYGMTWQTVAPMQVKKYAQAQLKQDIKLAVFKRWAFEHASDDVVDAYVLARVGLGLLDGDPVELIAPQKEVIATLRNPAVKKKRSSKAKE